MAEFCDYEDDCEYNGGASVSIIASGRRLEMEKAISATEGRRKFLQLLQGVRRGRTYVVTSHGKPVAKISRVEKGDTVRISARKTLLARLRSQPTVQADCWNRDDLYEDAQ